VNIKMKGFKINKRQIRYFYYKERMVLP